MSISTKKVIRKINICVKYGYVIKYSEVEQKIISVFYCIERINISDTVIDTIAEQWKAI